MAVAPLVLVAEGRGTAKALATTSAATEGADRATAGGSGGETSDNKAEETAQAACHGEEGRVRREVFLGRPEGVGTEGLNADTVGDCRHF